MKEELKELLKLVADLNATVARAKRELHDAQSAVWTIEGKLQGLLEVGK